MELSNYSELPQTAERSHNKRRPSTAAYCIRTLSAMIAHPQKVDPSMKTLVPLLFLIFTAAIPAVALPTVITLPATNITGYSATLNSTINPNGFITQVHYH